MTDARPQKLLQRYPLIPTIVTAACCALFIMQPYVGFMIFLVAIPWLPWAVFTLVRAVRNPARRKFHLTRIGIWVFALVAAMTVHVLRHYHDRQYADEIVMKVKGWHTAHGEYPHSVEEIGVDRKEMRNQLLYPVYSSPGEYGNNTYPRFSYKATFQIYSSWDYDFEQNRWVFFAD